MRNFINKLIRRKSLNQYEVGSREYFDAQKRLILSRPSLKVCYDTWYARMMEDARTVEEPGALVELGSGGGYLKDLEPQVITSDIVEGVADRVIDGRRLPFADRSVAALFLTHVLHHIPEVRLFFAEADRVLVPGGVISLVEVAHAPFARYFFSHHHPEPYRDDVQDWNFAQSDAMMDSNQALSWMIFVRDHELFQREFPNLKVETTSFLPWFSYLAGGGVTGPCLAPGIFGKIPPIFDVLLSPLSSVFALHWHIRIRKSPVSK